jgi:hypothetical protein
MGNIAYKRQQGIIAGANSIRRTFFSNTILEENENEKNENEKNENEQSRFAINPQKRKRVVKQKSNQVPLISDEDMIREMQSTSMFYNELMQNMKIMMVQKNEMKRSYAQIELKNQEQHDDNIRYINGIFEHKRKITDIEIVHDINTLSDDEQENYQPPDKTQKRNESEPCTSTQALDDDDSQDNTSDIEIVETINSPGVTRSRPNINRGKTPPEKLTLQQPTIIQALRKTKKSRVDKKRKAPEDYATISDIVIPDSQIPESPRTYEKKKKQLNYEKLLETDSEDEDNTEQD